MPARGSVLVVDDMVERATACVVCDGAVVDEALWTSCCGERCLGLGRAEGFIVGGIEQTEFWS